MEKRKQIYEIKENGKWEIVLAENIQAVFAYDKKHNLDDYRMGTMFSRAQTTEILRTARVI